MIKKRIVCSFFLWGALSASSQVPNWQNLDLINDSIFGISLNKAYKELISEKKSTLVTVAVIDSGVDTAHVGLNHVLWINPAEIAGNGKDDDNNGYIDDMHGWDFIGGSKGDVSWDNLEITRFIRSNKPFYDSLAYDYIPVKYQAHYMYFRKVWKEYTSRIELTRNNIERLTQVLAILDGLEGKFHKRSLTFIDFQKFEPATKDEVWVKNIMLKQFQNNQDYNLFKENELLKKLEELKGEIDFQLNLSFDSRSIVGDDYSNSYQRYYGNNDVSGPDPMHGTHVAGIIGAIKNSDGGMKGIADNVKIIDIRVVPKGDERDKDVANGIRYAVDNGARIINMSFGKPFSNEKGVVDEAVKYAIKKGILIVHAAGNEGKDLDQYENYPNKFYADSSGEATTWIEVGAIAPKDDSFLVAPFSNYGRTHVDIFAPGVQIYSTLPGSKYGSLSGTSMAAPVVSGLAALIWEYFPKLNAMQVKDVIMRSSSKVNHGVIVGNYNSAYSKALFVPFANICVSGGVVNAYQALKLAATL